MNIIQAEEIQIERQSPHGPPQKISGKIRLEQVSAHDEEERHRLEVGNDRMAYRLLRGGKAYPGFEAVLEKSLEILKKYVQYFRPTAVRRVILDYVDIIRIPGQSIELDDYFRLQVNLPGDPFGPLDGFAIRFVLPPTPRSDRMYLAFTTEPKREDDSLRFCMRWQSLCDEIHSLNDTDMRHRLTAAHEHLRKCFFCVLHPTRTGALQPDRLGIIMLYAPTHFANLDTVVAGNVREDTLDRLSWAPSGFFPGGVIPLSEIRIGETCYRLRESLRGEFLSADDFTCEFWVDGFRPEFIGRGERAHDAYRDWRDQVHEAFQELYGKRPFEMNEEDQKRWQVLESFIDVVGYRNETPVVVRQVGQVTRTRPSHRRIEWVDGKSESVNLDDWPGEFASYKPGQPFEADVEHDPLTWKMRKVRFVRRVGAIHPMAEGELKRFWQSLPTTRSLPVSERDWTET